MNSPEDDTKLLPGEKLAFTHLDEESEPVRSDAEINKKYAKGEVRIVTETARYPLNTIPQMVVSGDYELNPEFQRRHRWSRSRQSRLIESFIMNVPIPPIFLYENEFSHYQVMDGLQRLTAIYEFYSNELELEDLQEWPELNGRTYKTLPAQVRRGVDRRYLSSIILLQETAKDTRQAERLKQLVFERINSGGVRLEPQESRNAIYDGPLNRLCIKLSRNCSLCRMWGIPEPTPDEVLSDGANVSPDRLNNPEFRVMKDVELVLRFFAYRQRSIHNTNTLSRYHDNFLNYGNKLSPEVLVGMTQLFEGTVDLVEKLFHEKAFWLLRQRGKGKLRWRQHATTVVYDPLMKVCSQYLNRSSELIAKAESLQKRRIELFSTETELFGGRAVNPAKLEKREKALQNLFESELG